MPGGAKERLGQAATLVLLASMSYDPRYLEGIEHFNKCDFYEAHEVWEDLWQDYSGPSRKFYQGLIQVAVCLHHFGNGNIRGARKVYLSSRNYLDQYRPTCVGLDVDQFLAQMDACFAAVTASRDEFPRIEIDAERIPEIHLDPPAELPPIDDEEG